MTITQAGPGGKFYIAFLQFRDFKDAKKIIVDSGRGLITWTPPPIIKPQSELAQGEKPARDTVHGWRAFVITDTTFQHEADIMMLLERPSPTSENKYKDKEMPPAYKEGDVLNHELVYYKITPNIQVTRGLVNSVNSLRAKETPGQQEAQIKRAVICGQDGTTYRTIDLMDGLTEQERSNLRSKWQLTPSQDDFMFKYCRNIRNGLAFAQGPAGSGKTRIIKCLAEVGVMRGLKIAVVADANSAADNVAQAIVDKAWVAVRLHSMGKNS